MSKFLKYSLIVLTLMSLALTPVAHAFSPDHDSEECTICIYKPNTDFKVTDSSLVISTSFEVSQQAQAYFVEQFGGQPTTPFFGRAPPVSL